MLLQTSFLEGEQNHRENGTYINHDHTNAIKSIRMTLNSNQITDRTYKIQRDKKQFSKKYWCKITLI